MKNSKIIKAKTVLLGVMLAICSYCHAQPSVAHYMARDGMVYYHHEPMAVADAATFIELGYGYAKDRHNVYLDGRVLEFVDPTTFRLKTPPNVSMHEGPLYPPYGGYLKSKWNVYYDGKKLDASINSFVELGGGYAKDAFSVFFCGVKVKGAAANSFKYLGDGYAEDAFDTYFMGRKLE